MDSYNQTESLTYALLDGLFDAPPTLREVRGLKVLRQRSFSWRGTPTVLRLVPDGETVPETFSYLGRSRVRLAELSIADDYVAFSTFDFAQNVAELEWRWRNDRAALENENEQFLEITRIRRELAESRYQTRLKVLTLEAFPSETRLPVWDQRAHILPLEFITEVRKCIDQTIEELRGLGPKPKRPSVRRILKDLVAEINSVDGTGGYAIETEEREYLVSVLEEICHACKQQALVPEIDEWRNW